jgi:predicted esterase
MEEKLKFPVGVKLNLDKLIMSGYSFGGMTAIDVASVEPDRIKVCLTMDPWLFCRH